MESTVRLAVGNSPALSEAVVSPAQDLGSTLRVTATYLLSEEGRKASLLSGGNGRAVQQMTLAVPAERLHLVKVDEKGVARLKIRPRFELGAEQRVVVTEQLSRSLDQIAPARLAVTRISMAGRSASATFMARSVIPPPTSPMRRWPALRCS